MSFGGEPDPTSPGHAVVMTDSSKSKNLNLHLDA
jgi:hypothetical protein